VLHHVGFVLFAVYFARFARAQRIENFCDHVADLDLAVANDEQLSNENFPVVIASHE
jgi:hypothetical protein